MARPSKRRLALCSPVRFGVFFYAFCVRIILILAARLFLPAHPRYQSLRVELQRAYLISCSLHFPELSNRLPADYGPNDARPVHGKGWSGYLIPGNDPSKLEAAVGFNKNARVVLYAHGGGYARGVARMYVPYMKRWSAQASMRGLDLVFVSVEYTLSTIAPHPRQRDEFLAAYQYLLRLGIPASRIIFMGDSAGAGICTNSALHLPTLSLPQPASTILISPWLDMAMTQFEHGGNPAVTSDYLIQVNATAPSLVKLFLGNAYKSTDPIANPLYRKTGELKVLSPQLIFAGAAEFALYDSKEWAALCRDARVRVDLQIEPMQLHVWALGSKWIAPTLRAKTDRRIIDCIDRA